MSEKQTSSAISKIVKMGQHIQVAEMAKIAELAKAAGGSLTSVEPDGDWCGTGRFRVKWPPKKDQLIIWLDELVQNRINFEVLINGIPVPEEILVNVSRSQMRGR
jgi:hypothetical protein